MASNENVREAYEKRRGNVRYTETMDNQSTGEKGFPPTRQCESAPHIPTLLRFETYEERKMVRGICKKGVCYTLADSKDLKQTHRRSQSQGAGCAYAHLCCRSSDGPMVAESLSVVTPFCAIPETLAWRTSGRARLKHGNATASGRLDEILALVDESGAHGGLDGFVGCVDTELAEDVLAVGVDGVDARESLGGYLLSRLSLGYGAHDLDLSVGEGRGVLLVMPLAREEDFGHTLADVPPAYYRRADCVGDFLDGGVFEEDAYVVALVDDGAEELLGEVVAEQDPVGRGVALPDDEEVLHVGEVEERVVGDDHTVLMILEDGYELRLVGRVEDAAVFVPVEEMLDGEAC